MPGPLPSSCLTPSPCLFPHSYSLFFICTSFFPLSSCLLPLPISILDILACYEQYQGDGPLGSQESGTSPWVEEIPIGKTASPHLVFRSSLGSENPVTYDLRCFHFVRKQQQSTTGQGRKSPASQSNISSSFALNVRERNCRLNDEMKLALIWNIFFFFYLSQLFSYFCILNFIFWI